MTTADVTALNGLVIVEGGVDTRFGQDMAVGDVNGDQIDDLLIGARSEGQVFVVYGRKNLGGATLNVSTLTADTGARIFTENEDAINFGNAMAVGNVNGDAYPDLLIAARSVMSNGATDLGAVYVIFGQAGGLGTVSLNIDKLPDDRLVVLTGKTGDTSVGTDLAVGDVNGDGIDDILATAYRSLQAFVVYGRKGLANLVVQDVTPSTGVVIYMDSPREWRGDSANLPCVIADVTGDGTPIKKKKKKGRRRRRRIRRRKGGGKELSGDVRD